MESAKMLSMISEPHTSLLANAPHHPPHFVHSDQYSEFAPTPLTDTEYGYHPP